MILHPYSIERLVFEHVHGLRRDVEAERLARATTEPTTFRRRPGIARLSEAGDDAGCCPSCWDGCCPGCCPGDARCRALGAGGMA